MHSTTVAANLVRDLRQIAAVVGPGAAAQFAVAIARNAPAVARTGRLTAADEAMAGRSWTFRPLPNLAVTLPGEVFGGGREMYCRRVYHARPGFAPQPNEKVVDLGANRGLYSLMAAVAGARVLAVEAQHGFAPQFRTQATANRCLDQITLVNALVGATTGQFADDRIRTTATHWRHEPPTSSMTELLDDAKFERADLVKIDVEGSEFALFREPGWLDRVGRIVMEVHPPHGDPGELLGILRDHGFDAWLMDNALRDVRQLGTATSGYLYASRRSRHVPNSRPLSAAVDVPAVTAQ